jgi:hypothetical protein
MESKPITPGTRLHDAKTNAWMPLMALVFGRTRVARISIRKLPSYGRRRRPQPLSRDRMEERHGGNDGSHTCAVERSSLGRYHREPSCRHEQRPPDEAILQEVVTLRRAAGKLAPSEFRGCGPLARTEAEEQAWCPRFSGFRDSQARQAITLELAAQPTPFAVQAEKIQPHLCP